MQILGIETSCDETAAAVVQDGTKILSNVVATSAEMHTKTGGIIPETAARQQVKSIMPVIQQSLPKASTKIDTIAVTIGPGLIGSLLVGVETAKTLAFLWKKPIVPVNHLVGHIYANWLVDTKHPPKFPLLALVVSGGHTDIVLMRRHGNLEWIGGTRDDAAGEAFDKTARLLDLGYPGGPAISTAAEKFFNHTSNTTHQTLNMFPRPIINKDNFDFSFSGLKTAVLRTVQSTKNIEQKIPQLAAEVQEAIVDCLVEKSIRAAKFFRPKSLLLAGGVAANCRLREKLHRKFESEKVDIVFHVPPPNLCTDNAAYIASCAFFNYHPVSWKKINTDPQLTITSKR
jgi:N6-L-threonylcarbamoyladenine synthase